MKQKTFGDLQVGDIIYGIMCGRIEERKITNITNRGKVTAMFQIDGGHSYRLNLSDFQNTESGWTMLFVSKEDIEVYIKEQMKKIETNYNKDMKYYNGLLKQAKGETE